MTRRLVRSLSVLAIIGLILSACGAKLPEPQQPDQGRPKPGADQITDQPAQPDAPVAPRPAVAPLPAGEETEWLIMLYQDADDQILEQDILTDFNEAERVGSTDQVRIVSQLDRYRGAYKGMGNWTSAKRFLITQDDDLNKIGSEELADLGEINMADGDTLVDFITWAVETYPARKYALILSDHGAGWPGGFSDPTPKGLGVDDIVLAEAFGVDNLWLMEINRSLEKAREATGIDKFELLGFDACLMSQVEVMAMVAPHAKYAVASEEVEPSLGWAYTEFLAQLVADPAMEGDQLAKHIVNSYIDQDQLIVDPEARRALVKREFDVTDEVSAEEVAEVKGRDVTLSAVDLAAMPDLLGALDDFAVSLSQLDQQQVAEARTYAQSYESVFGEDVPPAYIDLGHFAALIAQISGDPDMEASANRLAEAIQAAVIQERHGPERPGSTGLVIYFPSSELYNAQDNLGYAEVADVFAANSNWNDFLKFHYVGGSVEGGASRSARTRGGSVAAKPLEVAPITLSAETARAGEPVTLQSEVVGDRLGFVFTFIGRILPDEELLVIEDEDYMFADDTREVNGVQYPAWPDGAVSLEWEWEPIIFAINDGANSVRALIGPEEYDNDVPTYAANAKYIPADGSPAIRARLFFRDSTLTRIIGYNGTGANGGVREITPQTGDQFTIIESGFNLSQDATEDKFERDSGTLVYNDQPFTIEQIPAPAGSYVVGFIAEDLDGNRSESYENLFVENDQASQIAGFTSFTSDALELALLYPETWNAEESAADGFVFFTSDNDSTEAAVARLSFPDAVSNEDSDTQAIQYAEELFSSFDNFELASDIAPFVLGGFDGREEAFTLEQNGEPYLGGVVAATVKPGVTFAFMYLSKESDFDADVELFNQMLDSFDILVSGVSKEQQGAPQPEFGETVFVDPFDGTADFSLQPDSGDWGTAEYNPDGQFVVGLNAFAGPLYDFYQDVTLPDSFMLQLDAGYEGTNNNAYGVIFRVQDVDQFYAFNVSGDGYFIVERFEGENTTTLIDWTASSAIVQDELTANSLAVVASEGNYKLYINGEQVGEFDDTTYSGGSLGIITDNFDEENPVNFYFDEMVVGFLQ